MGRSLCLLLLLASACGRWAFNDVPESGLLVVSSTSDGVGEPGTLSIRDALLAAEADSNPNRIVFDADVFPATITLASPLVIASPATTIDATGLDVVLTTAAGFSGNMIEVSANDVILDNLTFTGAGSAISSTQTTGLVVRHATIRDIVGAGIRLDTCTNAAIEDARIERAGSTPISLMASSDVRVQRVFVELSAKIGVVYGIYVEQSSQVHLLDNIIDPGSAHLIRLQNASNNEISGNILDRGDAGIVLTGGSSNNVIVRNVVISPVYDSVYVEAGGTANEIAHNTFYLASDVIDAGTGTIAANNLVSTVAADFVDVASYDFHLVAGSTAIDAASDLGLDLLPDQPARFFGAAPDIGGVESY